MSYNAICLKILSKNSTPSGGRFDTPLRRKRMLEIEAESSSDPNFWSDRRKSSKILKEKKALDDGFSAVQTLNRRFEDILVAIEFGEDGDEDSNREADLALKSLEKEVLALEAQRLLSGETDRNYAVITVNAGAGGTEACDWANMIFRMLVRHCEIRILS